LAGQSVVTLQPHEPLTHVPVVHGPHATPPVPHCWAVVLVTQLPPVSQHPLGHEVDVHLATHVPPEHVCAVMHATQDFPCVPQLESCDIRHWPEVEQQPDGQLVGVQPTLPSIAPSPPPASPEVPVSPRTSDIDVSVEVPSPPSCPGIVASPSAPPSVVPTEPSSGVGTSPIPRMAPQPDVMTAAAKATAKPATREVKRERRIRRPP
jgi:hypothetical protein